MKIIRNILTLLVSIVSLYHLPSLALIVGNKTAVFIVPNSPVFPASDSNNTMLGFGKFQGGFTLQDATTSCTFSSTFPVSGIVNMNGGTLHLQQDLILTDTIQLQGLGRIIGNDHTIEFCESITSLPSNFTLVTDATLIFKGNTALNGTLELEGNITIEGNNNTLDLASGNITVNSNTQVTFKNIKVIHVSENSITTLHANSTLILDNTSLVLTDDLSVDHSNVHIKNAVSITGPYILSYKSSTPCTIEENSTLLLDGGITFSFGKQAVTDPEPLIFTDKSSALTCGLCTLHITNSGAHFTKGILNFVGTAQIFIDSSDHNFGLTIGNNPVANDDFDINLGAGYNITLVTGAISYNNVSPNKFLNSAVSSILTVETAATFHLATTCNLPGNTFVAMYNGNFPNLEFEGFATLNANNTRVIIPSVGDATYKGFYTSPSGASAIYLNTNDYIHLASGTTGGIVILGPGNIISGTGYILAPLTLTSASSSVIISLQGAFAGPLDLNGGTLELLTDLSLFSPTIESAGTIDLGSSTLYRKLPAGYTTFTTPINLKGTLATFSLQGDYTLSTTLTFDGSITIDGNGNTLDMDGGNITINPNAQLTIKNTKLINVDENSIMGVSDSSSLILDNTSLILKGDLNADRGSIYIKNNVSIIGPHTLSYKSYMSCTIEDNSTLLLDGGITFSFGKQAVTDPEPFIFTSKSSALTCGLCTLHITNSGAQFTKGTLNFVGTTQLIVDSSDHNFGLTFGNSPVATDDFDVNFGAGCNTTLVTGAVTYNNVSPNGFLNSATSSVLTLDPAVRLHMSTTCNLPGNTFVEIYDGTFATVEFDDGATLNANNTRISIPGYGDATYKGFYADPTGADAIYLNTNDYIYIASGTPGGVIVLGANNIISGTGYIQTPLILTSTSSSVIMSLQGAFAGPLYLNGGTLALLTDLSLFSPTIESAGTIDLGNSTLYRKLPAGYTTFTTPINFKGTLATLSLQSDYTLSTTLTFDGNITIDGNGNTLSFDNGYINIDPHAQVTFKNIKLANITNSSFNCADDTSKIVFDNTNIILTEDCTFNLGSIQIKNLVTLAGPYIFLYDSSVSSTILADSTLLLTDDVELRFGRKTADGEEPFLFADKSSTLDCNQCTLHVTASGAALSRGKLTFNGSVILAIDSTDTQNGLIFGDHTAQNDLQILFGPGCLATLTSGVLTYNNLGNDGFSNSSPSSNFTLLEGVSFHITSSCNLPGNTFVIYGIPNLLLDPGTALLLNNTRFVLPGILEAVYTGYLDWTTGTNFIYLDNNNSVFLTNGSAVIPTWALGTPTQIGGVGSIAQPVLLTPGAVNLMSLQGTINAPIYLNGGTISLYADTVLTPTDCFVTPGVVNLNAKTCTLQPPTPSIYSVPLYWNGTSGTIQCTQDITLTTTWTFKGNTVLDCGGNSFNFDGGTLLVTPGSSLTIKNAQLNNIVQSSILCADNTGSITLYNVTWSQADDYIFAYGALNYKGSVFMTGADLRFTYASTTTSQWDSNTTLELDNLFTFAYAPMNNATTLLQFTDFTSKFILNHSVLYLNSGLHLTKGQLVLRQSPIMDLSGLELTLGDMTMTDSSADMQITFLDNSVTFIQTETFLQQGTFSYQNNNLTSFQSWNSATLQFNENLAFYLYRSIPSCDCTIGFSPNNDLYYYPEGCPIPSTIGCSSSGSPAFHELPCP